MTLLLRDSYMSKRLIEKNRTYRIPSEEGTTLLRVTQIGSETITLEDLATGKTRTMDRGSFQADLDAGKIYVSASKELIAALEIMVS